MLELLQLNPVPMSRFRRVIVQNRVGSSKLECGLIETCMWAHRNLNVRSSKLECGLIETCMWAH